MNYKYLASYFIAKYVVVLVVVHCTTTRTFLAVSEIVLLLNLASYIIIGFIYAISIIIAS